MPTEIDGIHASFNPLIKPFLVVTIGLTMVGTVVGIPLAVAWFLGLGRWWAQHYYDKLECHLSDRALRYKKGILVQVEKTIPLENIQDVTFIEGPILRHFHLSTLRFETAGHSAGQAGDMRLTGIMHAQQFRNRILMARDALRQAQRSGAGTAVQGDEQLAVLRSIDNRLGELVSLLKERQE